MRSRMRSRMSCDVAKLRRTKPCPGSPNSEPGDSATRARSRKNSAGVGVERELAAIEPREIAGLRRCAFERRQAVGQPPREVIAHATQVLDARSQPCLPGVRPCSQRSAYAERRKCSPALRWQCRQSSAQSCALCHADGAAQAAMLNALLAELSVTVRAAICGAQARERNVLVPRMSRGPHGSRR